MTYLDAIILGVIQALTEFLPVSLEWAPCLGQAVFGIQPSSGIAFEIMVHLGLVFSGFLLSSGFDRSPEVNPTPIVHLLLTTLKGWGGRS